MADSFCRNTSIGSERICKAARKTTATMPIRVDSFGGACNGSVQTFVRKVETFCKFECRDMDAQADQTEIHDILVWTLADNLKDNAREWSDSLPQSMSTKWEALKPAILDKYQAREDPDRFMEICLRLEKLSQGERTVDEYLQEAQKLYDFCQVSISREHLDTRA